MKKTKVIINSITIKDTDGAPDPNKLINWESEKSDLEISEAELVLPINVVDILDIQVGQVVEIHGGWTTSTDERFFYGFIEDIKPEGATYTVKCRNEMVTLVRQNVNKIYDSSVDASAGEVSEIVEDLIETYGGMTGTVQSSGTEDGKRIDEFKCINDDVFERILALKKALNWDLYYDDDTRVVFFQPYGFVNSGITLTVGTEIVGMPEWTVDKDQMINDLRIDGANIQTNITESGKIETDSGYVNESILLDKTPDIVELYMDAGTPPTTQKQGGTKDASAGHFYYVDRENKKVMPKTGTTFTTDHYAIVNYVWSAPAPVHMINQDSIDTYTSHKKTIELSDVSSIADAESRAQSILSRRSVPFVFGKFLVKSEVANIPNRGETINIVDTRSPKIGGVVWSSEYVVTSIKYSFPGATEEIEVGDKRWRMVDWQQSTEERLKQLENQFVRNQDILMELIDIDNSKTVSPRYRKIFTETYDVSELGFILGDSGKGVLGTNKLRDAPFEASVDHFIQQFENSYTENFIDDDFEGAGNASWSDTGSVNFTSGQIALSTSVDFNNNGTIIKATLTSTEVSGSFDYVMSADGGSNWESVTSGTAHTFTNTGTDLQWRATENAASTGEISKIIIEDYH